MALAVIRMGWLSAVGKGQHLHRRMVRTGVLSCCGLDPSSELLRGKPFVMQKPPPPSLWSNVYMDSFGIRKNVRGTKARKLVGKLSMSKILYKKILGKCGIPQTEKESVMSSAKAITMEHFGDGLQELAVPGLARLLEHVALPALVVIPGRVPLEWFQATFERLVFDFQHKLPCFGALSSFWGESTHWRGRKSKTDRSGNQVYLSVGVRYLIRIAQRKFATNAPETEAGFCASAGVTKDGLKGAIIKREMGELLSAGNAATSLVHRFFKRSDHLWADVTRILVYRSVRKHGRASQFLQSEVGRLFKVFRELQTGRKRMDGSLSRFCDFDITTWVVAARLGVVEGSLSRRRDFNIRAWVVDA